MQQSPNRVEGILRLAANVQPPLGATTTTTTTETERDTDRETDAYLVSILRARQPWLLGQSALEEAAVLQWLSLSVSQPLDLQKLDALLASKSFLATARAVSLADLAVLWTLEQQDTQASASAFVHVRRWREHVAAVAGLAVVKGSGAAQQVVFPIPTYAAPSPVAAVVVAASPAAVAAPTAAATPVVVADNAKKVEEKVEAPQKVEKKQKEEKKDAAAKEEKKTEAPATQEELDPSKLDIRVGLVVKCWNHPDSDKLLCEEIDLGEGTNRLIASGIRAHYSAEEVQGRKVIVLANLKERSIAGFKSQGMVLCASNKDHSAVKLVEPPTKSNVGDRVVFRGFTGEPATPAQVAKKKIFETLAPFLRTDSAGVAHWKDAAFLIGEDVCNSQLPDATVA